MGLLTFVAALFSATKSSILRKWDKMIYWEHLMEGVPESSTLVCKCLKDKSLRHLVRKIEGEEGNQTYNRCLLNNIRCS